MSQQELSVIRVRTRETVTRPDIAQFILRAARGCGRPNHALFVAELCRQVAEPYLGLFVGFADDTPRFTVCGLIPANALSVVATGLFIYSERAPRQLVADVYACLRGWFLKNGHQEAISLNTDYPDKVYLRVTRPLSADAEAIGSIIRYRF